MKCLIVSDSHGSAERIRALLALHRDAEVLFFLGDGLSDFDDLRLPPTMALMAVRGNCDFRTLLPDGSHAPKLGAITLGGRRILYTHGDLYGVKYHDEGLLRLLEEQNGDVVLYGHTHNPVERYTNTARGGVYLFNPGALSGSLGSYGILMISEQGALFSHGTIR